MSPSMLFRTSELATDVVADRCGHPGARVECTAGLPAL
jgi:hypothetical protein